jgi:tetratricopeptide (TPR) repeat protein
MKKLLSVSPVLITAMAGAILFASTQVTAREDLSNLNFFPQPLNSATAAQVEAAKSVQPLSPDLTLGDAAPWPGVDAAIAHYLAQVSSTEALSGPYDESLIQSYQSLASLYQQSGDIQKAVDMLEKELQIVRVNKGLYSVDQAEVLRSMVNTHVEAGDIESANQIQEALFNLELRAYGVDSIEFVASRLEWADWNMNHYLTLSADSSGIALSKSFEDPRVVVAYDNYVAALEVLQKYSRFADERMITTERKLAALNFIINRKMHKLSGETLTGSSAWQTSSQGKQKKLEQADSAHFFNGSSALKRAIAYSSSSPQPEYDFIAQRMLELGDWYLLFDRRAAAIDIYNNALEVLTAANIPEAEINRILSSGLPVQTPDMTWQKQVSADDYAGFIDVEFELSKYGTASNPQILSSTEQDSRIEKELIRTIRNCKFRPMFADGSAVDNEKVKLRYYYTL